MKRTNCSNENIPSPSIYAKKQSHSYQSDNNVMIESTPRPTGSGFNSFLRWFKRNEKNSEQKCKRKTKFSNESINLSWNESCETLSPPSSPILNKKSVASSCDSIYSTATTGFAFVSPVNYRPYGDAEQPEKFIAPGPITDTYRNRLKQQEQIRETDRKLDLTLRRKYQLFQDRTKSNDIKYSEYSLPNVHTKHSNINNNNNNTTEEIDNNNKKHRRTVSDSSKDKKSGSYVHVKGKRKAPQPPNNRLSRSTLSPTSTLTPCSTLGRNKKRKAPPPPLNLSQSQQNNQNDLIEPIFTEGFLEDKEIIAILDMPKELTDEQKRIIIENVVNVQEKPQNILSNDTLKLEKGILRSTKEIPLNDSPPLQSAALKIEEKTPTPLSPITPRPWYKRPISGSREPSSIPFKKEIILRTVDKRRNKKSDSNNLPDISFSRNSLFESAAKLGFFGGRSDDSSKNKKNDDKEKRKSGIGIPSISELDREAAEIVNKEHECEKARLKEENDKYYVTREELKEEDDKRKSTKELISKFEKETNTQNITINTAFIGRTDYFEDAKKPPTSPKPIRSLSVEDQPKNDKILQNKKTDILGLWKCPYCTLENPNWRIICEVCEKIKPYDLGQVTTTTTTNNSNPISSGKNSVHEWDTKAEKVRKYFQLSTGNTLLKSTSETSINKKNLIKSDNLGSPKIGLRNSLIREKPDLIRTQASLDETKFDRLETLEESNYETTKQSIKVVSPQNTYESNNQKDLEKNLSNHDELEKEKERIREMIRQMNARALAEKYPVIKKPPEPELKIEKPTIIGVTPKTNIPPTTTTNESNRLGAIKKLFTRKDKSKDDSILLQTIQNEKQIEIYEIKNDIKNDKNIYENFPIYENIKEKNSNYENIELTEKDNKIVEEMTMQLKSQKGVDDFKATLKSSPRKMNNTDTLAINKILRNLENAISDGEYDKAATLAKNLARMKVSLSVTRQKDRPLSGIENTDDLDDDKIVVDLFIEDQSTTKGPINLTIKPSQTINEIKQIILENEKIPINKQKIILKNQLITEFDDNEEISKFGITNNKDEIHLYILTTPIANDDDNLPNNQKLQIDELKNDLSGSENDISDDNEKIGAVAMKPIEDKIPLQDTLKSGWTCPLCTLINLPNQHQCAACTESRPNNYKIPKDYENIEFKKTEEKNDLNKKQNPYRKSTEIMNIKIDEIEKFQPSRIPIKNLRPSHTSIVMTVLNNPNITRNKYRGVDNFNPKYTPFQAFELPKQNPITLNQKEVKSLSNIPTTPTTNHYTELLNLDNTDLITNFDSFDCPICFLNYKKGDGIILRDCFHVFCRECLSNTIQYSDDIEIKCPFIDLNTSCDSIIQEREIKSLVTYEIYEQHLRKSVVQAEHGIKNAFHCKTPNCRGWCIYEDNVNQFVCPVCKITNCLTCQAIHDGLNCKQYQDRISSGCDNNLDAKRTKDMLQGMVDKGEAMNCPTCQVILMKKWGCDWLKCSMCKTEICWVTRGPRWGPGGKGDTSQGCKCGVNGKKCHSQCNYCH